MRIEKTKVKETKKQFNKGITLIALVITIIILLILAGVSIAMLTGENGVLTKAQDAADEYEKASQEEQDKIDDLGNKINEFVNGSNQGKKLTDMYDSRELNIGDYVDYKNPTNGTYTAYATDTGVDDNGFEFHGYITNQVFDVSKNQLNWRVLGKDKETGGIKLIAGSPMKSDTEAQGKKLPYLFMYGAKAYMNGVNILTNIGALYKNEYAMSARSVNIEDINDIVGIKTEDDIKNFNVSGYLNGKQYGTQYNYTNHYTPESWINGKNKTTISGTVDAYFYSVNSQIGTYPYVTLSNTRAYDMLFDNIEYNKGKNYWLASSATHEWQNFIGFSLGLVAKDINTMGISDAVVTGFASFFDSNTGNSYEYYGGVRPVVILNPNVTEEQVPVIEDKVEEKWNVLGD